MSAPIPTDKAQIRSINNMRALAAGSVLLFHFTNASAFLEALPWLKRVTYYGQHGVDMFFVISGFVLPYALYKGQYQLSSYGRFALKRLARLEPPYLVNLAFLLALRFGLSLAKHVPAGVTWQQVALHLGYLNAFFQKPWLSEVYWTLSVEFQYYLLLGLLFPLLIGTPWVRRGLLAALLAAGWGFHFLPHDFFFPHAPVFVCGMAAFLWYVGRIGKAEFATWLAAAAGLELMLGDVAAALVGLLSVALIFRFSWHTAWLTFLGNISYSLYLMHNAIGASVIGPLKRMTDNTLAELGILALAIGMAIAVSWLLYHFVEKPSQRLASSIKYR